MAISTQYVSPAADILRGKIILDVPAGEVERLDEQPPVSRNQGSRKSYCRITAGTQQGGGRA